MASLLDIGPIFKLIQLGSAQGHFCNLYLQPRYQAGLAMQLFSVFFRGKIRLPGGDSYRAELHVLRERGQFAGFALVRIVSVSSRELYMCAVEPALQGKGYGRVLLEKVFGDLPAGCAMETECLPAAGAMKRLLYKLGFEPVGGASYSIASPEKFRYTAPGLSLV